MPGWLRRIVTEPLVGFLIAGAALFAVDAWRDDPGGARIVVTRENQAHLADIWQAQTRRPPTRRELDMLIEQYIREEVLVREALRMGLDNDDVIIRRRLVQKLEFLSGDIATATDPGEAELADYFAENQARYAEPERRSFAHVYFSADARPEARDDARRVLATLNDASWRAAGDPFMLRRNYAGLSRRQVSDLFGGEFAEGVFGLPADGAWHGPIRSSYGWHLVRVEDVRAAFTPQLDAVRRRVLEDWRSQRRREANDAWYQALRDGYEIEVEDRPAEASR